MLKNPLYIFVAGCTNEVGGLATYRGDPDPLERHGHTRPHAKGRRREPRGGDPRGHHR